MWQELYAELEDRDFMIIAVAFDSREGAAAPWVEQASPDYTVLVDAFHHVADLYNMVNVNQAVWIDEEGRIVRPTESSGAYEAFRQRDPKTGEIPQAAVKTAETVRTLYHDALRDWVAKGAASEFAFDAAAARAHLDLPTDDTAMAHACFALGQYLIAAGQQAEGDRLVARASELHPDSWAIWRQGAELDERGLAATDAFWRRVEALGEKRYYGHVDMPGMPA